MIEVENSGKIISDSGIGVIFQIMESISNDITVELIEEV